MDVYVFEKMRTKSQTRNNARGLLGESSDLETELGLRGFVSFQLRRIPPPWTRWSQVGHIPPSEFVLCARVSGTFLEPGLSCAVSIGVVYGLADKAVRFKKAP